MFRIARIRLRWTKTDQQDSQGVPLERASSHGRWHPLHLRVRVRWVGSGSTYSGAPPVRASVQPVGQVAAPPPGRVFATFNLPGRQVRLRWLGIGLGSLSLRSKVLLGLYVILFVIFLWTRPAQESSDQSLEMQPVLSPGLITNEINLGSETIRMNHSPLDIGEAKNVFDGDLETLMRGRDANPFIVDLELPQPEAITGIMMDFGRMDFKIRIQVYGADVAKPVFYEGEYLQQPPIPHIDINFDSGPQQVTRIYIEIEQINPPEEVHVHVREIVFKK